MGVASWRHVRLRRGARMGDKELEWRKKESTFWLQASTVQTGLWPFAVTVRADEVTLCPSFLILSCPGSSISLNTSASTVNTYVDTDTRDDTLVYCSHKRGGKGFRRVQESRYSSGRQKSQKSRSWKQVATLSTARKKQWYKWLLSPFSPFTRPRSPAQRMVPSTITIGLPTSLNEVKIIPYWHIQGPTQISGWLRFCQADN